MWTVFLVLLFCLSSFVHGKGYKVLVSTSDGMFSSTDATVYIQIYGTLGSLGPRQLPDGYENFERGNTDVFLLQDYDIGYVKGMLIKRGTEGFFPNWHLQKVVIQIAEQPDSIFYYNGWVEDSWTSLTLSCASGYAVNPDGFCSAKE